MLKNLIILLVIIAHPKIVLAGKNNSCPEIWQTYVEAVEQISDEAGHLDLPLIVFADLEGVVYNCLGLKITPGEFSRIQFFQQIFLRMETQLRDGEEGEKWGICGISHAPYFEPEHMWVTLPYDQVVGDDSACLERVKQSLVRFLPMSIESDD